MKSLLKYPIFIIGLTLFVMFIFDNHTKKWWDGYTSRFKPDICRDAMERAEKMGPKKWSLSCEDQVLKVESSFDLKDVKKENYNRASYRELANELTELAKTSNTETIERIKQITYSLKTSEKTIVAYTTGEAIAKLQALKDDKAIAFHIHTSVKVKEISK